MEIHLLRDVVTIFGLSIIVLLLCHRLHVPTIVGFLVTGVISGPNGLGLIRGAEDVKALAEIGIVLLLFSIGMEFSLKKLFEAKRFFLVAGGLQVALTVAAGYTVGVVWGRPLDESIFLGFLLSLSSTAIVLGLLEKSGQTLSPLGKITLSILIFQDIIAIPMMLMIPFLAEQQLATHHSLLYVVVVGLLILACAFVMAEYVVPKVMYFVARTKNRELFLLTMLTLCFAVAWFAANVGLSLSLGAFLAGLIVSETEYRHEAMGDISPFKDAFTSVFFVSIGMLLDLRFVLNQPFLIFFIALGVLCLKFLIVAFTTLVVGMPLRLAVLTGLALCQVGEFSFVLAKAGFDSGLVPQYYNQLFLAVAIITMTLTPSLISCGETIAGWLHQMPFPIRVLSGLRPIEFLSEHKLQNHLVIIGFGLGGRKVAKSARAAGIEYIAIDMNPERVKREKLNKEPVHFGDATHTQVLTHAHIQKAQVVVIMINDALSSLRIVESVRRLSSNVYVIVRTRYIEEAKLMYQMGANDVIPDELGASIEVFTQVLKHYEVPQEQMNKILSDLRIEGYDMSQLLYRSTSTIANQPHSLAQFHAESFTIGKACAFVGKTVAESELRKTYGLTIVMLKRNDEVLSAIGPEEILKEGDVLVVTGNLKNLKKAKKIFGGI